MNPAPLHRSPGFWLGIFVLLFLGWAWRDSTRYSTSWFINRVWDGSFASSPGIWHYDSRVSIRIARNPGPIKATISNKGETQYLREPLTDSLGPPTFIWETWPPSTTFSGALMALQVIELPHWLLILAFVLFWTACLAWRHRRIRRVMKASMQAHQAEPTS